VIKRIALFVILAGVAFLAWENRHHFKELAGLESNQMRIEGDWYQVRSNIREFDRYSFNDNMVDRNGETYGEYSFTSNEIIQVVLGSSTGTYIIEFPQAGVMIWYQELPGTRQEAIRWVR
jgi:hypothetical protein